ncbi:hypothetical protein N2152v2_007276 [Parachlorella kessleri]
MGSSLPPAKQQGQQQTQLVVQEQPSILGRWLDAGLLALHKLLKVVTLQGLRAPELYVREMLEKRAGLDPFTVDMVVARCPSLLRLSWQHDMEPVLEWLHAQGLRDEDLAVVLSSCPGLLGKSVDEQLQPVAELVEQLGGRPVEVLRRYPQLGEVPVAHLAGTWHVLRQVGASREEVGLLLVLYPDMYARLAGRLRELFTTYSRLGLKAYIEERQRYTAVLLRQDSGSMGGSGGGGGDVGVARGGNGTAGAAEGSVEGAPQVPRFPYTVGDAIGAGVQPTTYLCDDDVAAGLRRVAAALSALSMLPEQQQARQVEEDHDAALGELELAIDELASVEGLCLPAPQAAGTTS